MPNSTIAMLRPLNFTGPVAGLVSDLPSAARSGPQPQSFCPGRVQIPNGRIDALHSATGQPVAGSVAALHLIGCASRLTTRLPTFNRRVVGLKQLSPLAHRRERCGVFNKHAAANPGLAKDCLPIWPVSWLEQTVGFSLAVPPSFLTLSDLANIDLHRGTS